MNGIRDFGGKCELAIAVSLLMARRRQLVAGDSKRKLRGRNPPTGSLPIRAAAHMAGCA